MTGPTKTADRVSCEEENCHKDYASKAGLKDHMKKVHQSVVLSLVQDVVNFLSPQPARVAETITATSPLERTDGSFTTISIKI